MQNLFADQNLKTVEFPDLGITMKVLSDLSVSAMEKILEAHKGSSEMQKVLTIVCAVVREWNIERDGKPLPIEPESLQNLKYQVAEAILKRVMEENETLRDFAKLSQKPEEALEKKSGVTPTLS